MGVAVAERLGTTSVELNMDLVRKIYQRSIFPDVLEVAQGGRLAAPLVVDLDPTTLCDLACPECISSDVLHSGQLSRDRTPITALVVDNHFFVINDIIRDQHLPACADYLARSGGMR